SATVVGDVLGKYHPHGDRSVYEAMVRMAQEWKINIPLVEMHGNKGSVDNDPPAAMRYTETRLSKVSNKLIEGIKKNSVSFAPNFDDSEREPTVLPALFPNLLVNGAKGIASGYATEMPPHNLSEVVDAIIAKIKSPNARLRTLMKYIKGPDFPTGGEIQGIDGIYKAFERGQGRIVIRSKYEINNSKTNPFINITEIPYGVVKSKLVRDIDEKRFNRQVSGIKEIRDETDRNGLSIMIELTPGTNPEIIAKYLLSKTEMQIYYNYNNVAIVNNAPKVLSLSELIDSYVKHQRDVQTRSINFDFERDSKRLEIVDGLIKVAGIADDVIDTIRKAEGSKQGVIRALINRFNFTEVQASAIAELRLYRLSRTDQSIYITEQEELNLNITRYKSLLENQSNLDEHIISELREFKKQFGQDRKSIITSEIERIEINVDDLIKHEDVWVGVSKQGYIKRLSNRTYEANKLEQYKVKDNDSLIYIHKINTIDKLLVFTSKGRYIFIPTHKIPEEKWKKVGTHINDFAAIDVDESIVDAISVNDFSLNMNLVLATETGKIKRTPISSFQVSRFSKPLIGIKLIDDKLVAVRITNGLSNIVMINSNGKAVKYSETTIPLQGTKSKGFKGISLNTNTRVTNLVAGSNTDIIGLISQRGSLKRIKMSEVSSASRMTQGKEFYRQLKNKPHEVIDARVIKSNTTASLTPGGDQDFKVIEMKIVPITSTKEGFSNPVINSVDGRIIVFNRIHSNSSLVVNISKLSNEDVFRKAENDIKKAGNLSIDDILKGL
ncbi:MAG: DNA topoisomerase 4 subunit A, partial [Mycoplasmataceae bacterium]|nr:DNA topoisomerase 4 subunit A [Mycoplasmataceae bacterium]